MFKCMLVPTDGSPLSEKAIKAAVEFAKELGGEIIALSVAEPYPFSPISEVAFTDERRVYEDKARDVAEEHVQKVQAAAHALNVPCEAGVTQSFTPFERYPKTQNNHHTGGSF